MVMGGRRMNGMGAVARRAKGPGVKEGEAPGRNSRRDSPAWRRGRPPPVDAFKQNDAETRWKAPEREGNGGLPGGTAGENGGLAAGRL